LEDGHEIGRGPFQVPALAPGEERSIALPYRVDKPKAGAEYFVNLSIALGHDERWAKAGYELAAAQFTLPIAAPAVAVDPATLKPLALSQNDREIRVAGDAFTVVFDRAAGTIARIERDGVNVLAPDGGPRLHLWRAPHRNDDMWAYRVWEKEGVTTLKFTPVSIEATEPQRAVVRVTVVLEAKGQGGFAVTHKATYTVFGDGTVSVDNDVRPEGPRTALARLGVRMLLDRRLDRFDFLGRGPVENYADRKRGFDVGLYGSSVADQMTLYQKPMESGNHEDVRWAAVTGKGMPGLMVQAAGDVLQASALPYTDEQIMPIEYRIDLPQPTVTELVVAAKTLGVGSNGCGPRPLDQYIVWSDPATFSYVLRILPTGQAPTADLGRTRVSAIR
jgi:beta-galactosidase